MNNQSQVNFTQHTQQAHPNLQAAQAKMSAQNHKEYQNNNAQGHLSASQFDISALLRNQNSIQGGGTSAINQQSIAAPVLDFQDLCSTTS